MDHMNRPYVWCGTCCAQTAAYDSAAEAITAWNTRAAARDTARLEAEVAAMASDIERLQTIANSYVNGDEFKALLDENVRLREAVEYAHAQGFEWPSDPMQRAALPDTRHEQES